MASNVKLGTVSIDLKASTAQFQQDLDQAKRKLGELGSHGVTNVQATSAALRVLEGNMANNLRAAERFVAGIKGVGPALQAAFPIVGGIALLGVLSELVKKAKEGYDAFRTLGEAPSKIGESFAAIVQPIRLTNDELRITNDRLSNEIAKLQGRPQNGLKLALDEATKASDRLAESMSRTFSEIQKTLGETKIGLFAQLLGAQGGGDFDKAFGGESGFGGFNGQALKLYADYDEKLRRATTDTERQAIQNQRNAAETKLLGDALAYVNGEIGKLNTSREQGQHRKIVTSSPYGPGTNEVEAPDSRNYEQQLERAYSVRARLEAQLAQNSLEQQNGALTGQRDRLKATEENSRGERPFANTVSQLKAELEAVTATAKEAGKENNGVAKAMADGYAEATKKVSELNERLKETKHKPLNLGQLAEITGLETSIALEKEEAKLAENTLKRNEKVAEISEEIQKYLAAENEKRQEKITKLKEEITAAEQLAAAEGKGSEAVFAKQVDLRTAGITDPEEKELTGKLLRTEHGAKDQGEIAQLEREAAATQNLTKARLAGIQAQRNAQLQNIANSGQSPEVIKARQAALQAQYDLQDAGDLRHTSASQGLHAYFQEMADEAKSAGQIVHQTIGSAFEGLNDQLSRLVSGQKTNFASFFKGISSELAKLALGNLESSIFKSILGSGSGSGGLTGGFGGIIKNLFGGFRADGGDVDPGHAFVVGERGPEVFTPPGAGSIVPNHKLGGGNAYYTIDARGTDPVAAEQRMKTALVAVHGSAVQKSFQAQQERAKRTPQKQ